MKFFLRSAVINGIRNFFVRSDNNGYNVRKQVDVIP